MARSADQRAGTQQHDGRGNVRAVGIGKSDCTIDAGSTRRVGYDVREFECTVPKVALAEYAFREAAEEEGHSMLEHAPARESNAEFGDTIVPNCRRSFSSLPVPFRRRSGDTPSPIAGTKR